jgi:hypothetical protein
MSGLTMRRGYVVYYSPYELIMQLLHPSGNCHFGSATLQLIVIGRFRVSRRPGEPIRIRIQVFSNSFRFGRG